MADRYWVGGTAAWDATAGTKWSATDGGTGGASLPTINDDVYFTALSGTVTVSVSGGSPACRNLNFTGFTGTLDGSVRINLAGNCTLVTGMGFTYTGPLSWQASTGGTFISAGKTVPQIELGSTTTGPTLNLGDALTSSSNISITGGTFTTNNYSVTATYIQLIGTTVAKTLNLGSSQVTLTSNSGFAYTSGVVTLNAGTSHIILTAASAGFSGGNLAFYDVSFTATTAGTYNIVGANTFNNLSIAAPASAGVRQVTFANPCTINGTLSTTGTAGNRRVWFRSATYGIAQTLTINSAPSLTDADFRDIYVIGTAAPISGTRIGDLRGCSGITFSTPKNVYYYAAAGNSWSSDTWALTSFGPQSTNAFPLAQDTVIFQNVNPSSGATVTLDSAIPYTGSVLISGRTDSINFHSASAFTVYGNWTNSVNTTFSGSAGITFSGRKTQTIVSNGRTFNFPITIDSYGGTVELVDALNIGSSTLTVTNGTFNTKNYNVTAAGLSSSNSNVRAINLGSSTVTLSSGSAAMSMNNGLNLVFNSGTSNIVLTGTASSTPLEVGGVPQLYDVTFTKTTAYSVFVNGAPTTIRNLTITAPASAGITEIKFSSNFVVTGTLTCTGATAVRRIFLRSGTLGTTRTLTVNSLSSNDCDFRDITIAGAAAGSSPTRAGDCGGNTGITFPAAKTVYWNLSSTSTWFGNGWCPTSGGTPNVNSFPLAQDTAVFDDAGAATTVNPNVTCNIGTIDMSARTTAITSQFGACTIYGNVTLTSALTITASGTGPTFSGRGTQTVTSAGVTFDNPITIDCVTGTVQLADALTLGVTRALNLTSGTFDVGNYNITTGLFNASNGAGTNNYYLNMGSGTWTLGSTGTIWNTSSILAGSTLLPGTATVILSNNTTTARTFNGESGVHIHKLIIGGNTSTSTTTLSGDNCYGELASTKTVAHTIALGSSVHTFGKWSVTGTAGNVVTVTGTGQNIISGPATSGIDYLAMGTVAFSTSASPGEFYAGANSTGSGVSPVFRTAPPAPRTLYWVGGTGNWSDPTKWSTTSGGSGGAAIPTSLDDVIFNSSSSASAYTSTINTNSRCKSLTISGPASGNLTLAGSSSLLVQDSILFPSTGLTRTYTGVIYLSGTGTGKTLTTNGVILASAITVEGVGCEWQLGSALTSSGITLRTGGINFANYAVNANSLTSLTNFLRTANFTSSTFSTPSIASGNLINFGTTALARETFNLIAGTSLIFLGGGANIIGNNKTFYDVTFAARFSGTLTSITGENTYNNLTLGGATNSSARPHVLNNNQIVNGSLIIPASANATQRCFVYSNVTGTPRTVTCAAFSGTDADFRDITIAGAAAPVSGTRLGDCKGNSGITFDAPKTVYTTGSFTSVNWSSFIWSTTQGGAQTSTDFPLAQDTVVITSTAPSSGGTITIDAAYNIGTIDMSARTSNTMTLATGSTRPQIYGNWINGTGTTLTGLDTLDFVGRGSQTITSAGKAFAQKISINTQGGSVTLQDAITVTRGSTPDIGVTQGTFDANGYSVTTVGQFASNGSLPRTIAIGSATWLIGGSGWDAATATNLTVTGTGTISLTSSSVKAFAGGGIDYSGITLNQGGVSTLTITGNNTFANITNTYKATGATTIALGNTTQKVNNFTASGEAGRLLTITGTSASSPANLILTSGTVTTPDYLNITGVRAYDLNETWYAGANSINNGSLGWIFASATVVVNSILSNFFLFF